MWPYLLEVNAYDAMLKQGIEQQSENHHICDIRHLELV
jgi:hypothetical protein